AGTDSCLVGAGACCAASVVDSRLANASARNRRSIMASLRELLQLRDSHLAPLQCAEHSLQQVDLVCEQIEQRLALHSQRDAAAGHVRPPPRGLGAAKSLVHADAVARLCEGRLAAADGFERELALENDVDRWRVAF